MRRFLATLFVALLGLGGFVVWGSAGGSSQFTPLSSDLQVSIPGTFSGCRFDDPRLSTSMQAVLDLTRPSAFTLQFTGRMVGQAGPIQSAELRSLHPQTVVYTVAPGWRWSDGSPFNATDLVSWAHHAAVEPGTWSEGYRHVASMSVSPNGSTLTVVFATAYPFWNNMFRDVEAPSAPLDCSLAAFPRQPSLGVYQAVSVTATRVMLRVNPLWKGPRPGYNTVTLYASGRPAAVAMSQVSYSTFPSMVSLAYNAGLGLTNGKIASTANLVTLGFSPQSPAVGNLFVRQALAWSLTRRRLVSVVLGGMTYQEAPAPSLAISQGQLSYGQVSGIWPSDLATTTTLKDVSALPFGTSDGCGVCVNQALAEVPGLHIVNGVANRFGRPLVFRVGVGGSALDREVAESVSRTWQRGLRVRVVVVPLASSNDVVAALRQGRVDIGIYEQDTSVGFANRVLWGSTSLSTLADLGWDRTPLLQPLLAPLLANLYGTFNPSQAQSLFTQLDQIASDDVLAWPLFTVPYSLRWSPSVTGVLGSVSIAGFVNELPGWTPTPVSVLKSSANG